MGSTLRNSLKTSLKSSMIILKLIIPIYILADLLFYYNLLSHVSFILEPITYFLDLPSAVALSLISGMLLNIYAAIAFAAPLDLSPREWTILGVYLGICHSLLVETAVMQRIGISKLYSVSLRIGAGLFIGFITTLLPHSLFSPLHVNATQEKIPYDSLPALLQNSLYESLILSMQVIALISILIFVMDFIKSLAFIKNYSEKVSSAFSISIGVMLGITYGAGILISEYEKNTLSKKDILFIGTFLMICHAIVEDTLLFVIFGANLWVIIVLRVIFAFIFAYGLITIYQRKNS
ncbi:MAG: nucleoside recognition protein [Sulfurospirillum sp.]|nr:nucleoside recognition protein [Sulfurospirillum sp.]